MHRLRPIFWLVTQGGWFGSVPIWCAIALAARHKRLAFDILGAALLSWVLAQGGKEMLPLDRPWDRIEGTRRIGGKPWGSSFPSGHPAVAWAVAGVLGADDKVPRSLSRFARTWACGVALSRMVVGAHYPLDVIAGSAAGDLASIIWLEVATRTVDSETEESPSPDDGAALEMR